MPGRTLIRDVLTRVDPDLLDRALQGWNAQYAATADALLTQRRLARYLVKQRAAHHVFIAKDNQPALLADIRLCFKDRAH